MNVGKADVFYCCDYGTGDGLSSMPVIYSAVEKIKETFGGEQNIHVMYEDQPLNEFKQIFLKLNGMYVSYFSLYDFSISDRETPREDNHDLYHEPK